MIAKRRSVLEERTKGAETGLPEPEPGGLPPLFSRPRRAAQALPALLSPFAVTVAHRPPRQDGGRWRDRERHELSLPSVKASLLPHLPTGVLPAKSQRPEGRSPGAVMQRSGGTVLARMSRSACSKANLPGAPNQVASVPFLPGFEIPVRYHSSRQAPVGSNHTQKETPETKW